MKLDILAGLTVQQIKPALRSRGLDVRIISQLLKARKNVFGLIVPRI